MITQLLIAAIAFPLLGIIKLLFLLIPDMTFLAGHETAFSNAMTWFYSMLNYINPIIPSSTVLVVFGVVTSYYAFLFGFRFLSWVLRKIPIIGIS